MGSPAKLISNLFKDTALTELQVTTLVQWLQETPKITTIRVNLLQTSTTEVQEHILRIMDECNYITCRPSVNSFDLLPEVILIGSIAQNASPTVPLEDNKEVVVDVSCAAAVLRGAHIYGPGILAMQSNTKIGEMVNIFVDKEGVCRKGTNIVFESRQKTFIGFGEVKMQRYELFGLESCKKGIAVKVYHTISCVPSLGSDYLTHQSGLLQNFPSIVCGRVLDPKSHEIILDMCASPGNKTSHIAQLMNDCGVLVALDKSEKRVSLLRKNIELFQLNSVRCFTFDATKAFSNSTIGSNDTFSPPFAADTFDRILLDAPCSGLGNRPIFSTKLTPKALASFPKLQQKLLDVALKLLKINGILVYSTCSVHEAENEMIVAWILNKYGHCIELETATPLFGRCGLKGAGLNDEQRKKVQRFGPPLNESEVEDSITDSIGFFICKFRKISNI